MTDLYRDKTNEDVYSNDNEHASYSDKYVHWLEEMLEEYANQDKWISVKDELPDAKKVGGKILLFREMNESQKNMAIVVYDTFLVKHCDPETTFWQSLPNPPKQ